MIKVEMSKNEDFYERVNKDTLTLMGMSQYYLKRGQDLQQEYLDKEDERSEGSKKYWIRKIDKHVLVLNKLMELHTEIRNLT